MLNYMFMPYRRYFDFSGRSSRAEYWWFVALQVACLIPVYAILYGMGAFDPGFDPDTNAPGALFYIVTLGWGLFGLVSLIPIIAVEVRRWHDLDKSGWFWFIRLVPLVGTLIVIFFMIQKGTSGSNRFGTDPTDVNQAQVFS